MHQSITENWDPKEAVVYLREGDPEALRDLYGRLNLPIEYRKPGYLCVHYIIPIGLTKETVFCELQFRTLFEEGWSEIDHEVRYRYFSHNPLVVEFLDIFNRLCGAADGMGTFVRALASSAEAEKEERTRIVATAVAEQQDLVAKISALEEANAAIPALQAELRQIRAMASAPSRVDAMVQRHDAHRGIPGTSLTNMLRHSALPKEAFADIIKPLSASEISGFVERKDAFEQQILKASDTIRKLKDI